MNDDKTLNDQMAEDVKSVAVSATQQIDYLVKQMSADLDKLGDQIKEQRQMVTDAFKNDSRYQEMNEKIKDLNKQRQVIQKELSGNEAVQRAKKELDELNNQRKALMSKLSEYLKQYVEQFNSRTLKDLEGNLKEIITQYKLVRQRKME
ncbi:hypothetical protein A3A55_00475 [Candidatus Roizmanbacteria bacterium RIFCSPLOWO2_01_FULL_40_14]|uniref:Uncharacterized protein n=1 Tax=Candidatus Roizmanbacteria bacterium GW2011_GWA1_41_13 TaxID=1618474 RepID=A0A0G0UVI0_9BACT|nr:MAG: hypothetical protein UT85_C0007G0002 [Candidatus Levybacteria bacterium GW2011_GWA2_40_16]KKR91551.1 MAG: hypothetical protein UU41_C0035G0016 [Candidatus Roizmanbacteria bacterium GW2011_GWA1_41_13]OGK49164.1 MAG: hypothetical protein A3A55_00475 [Candidatus Roizmanbacteria bacterium RIFCSPLOWO2_01_FULL_40_14]